MGLFMQKHQTRRFRVCLDNTIRSIGSISSKPPEVCVFDPNIFGSNWVEIGGSGKHIQIVKNACQLSHTNAIVAGPNAMVGRTTLTNVFVPKSAHRR
jgi:hypothetical protein